MPELLDTLAEAIERNDASALPMKGLPNLHAALRVREGYDLRQVVAEYRALRRVIHELYSISGTFHAEQLPAMQALTVMDTAVDAAIVDAVDQYALDREKSRDMFIGMLGHDLRDPLNTIMFGIASLVEKYAEELACAGCENRGPRLDEHQSHGTDDSRPARLRARTTGQRLAGRPGANRRRTDADCRHRPGDCARQSGSAHRV
jgi:signal transduction histidine kinase